jgi:unsaturated chondroitin disaccharide hydrolase
LLLYYDAKGVGHGYITSIMEKLPENGDFVDAPGGQGYESGSSWSRGQSWALYGYALSYTHTKEERYLAAAKRIAHYFIANVATTDSCLS